MASLFSALSKAGDLLDTWDDSTTSTLKGVASNPALASSREESKQYDAAVSRGNRFDSMSTLHPSSAALPRDRDMAEVAEEEAASSTAEQLGVVDEVGPAKVGGSPTHMPLSGAFGEGQNNSRVSSSSTAASSAPVSPAISSSQYTTKKDVSSGEVVRLLEENQSLRQVWEETRGQLQKVKDMLNKSHLMHKRELVGKDKEREVVMQAQRFQHQKELGNLQQATSASETEVRDAQRVVDRLKEEFMVEKQVLARREQKLLEDLSNAKSAIHTLDEEKHQLLERINETQQSYRKALNDLKAQEQHREVNYGREKKVHSNTLRSLQERESLLETDKEEMISAVMLAQEELQEKTAQLKREEAARQWVEADRDGVQVQLGQCKARLETELNERQQHHENARRRIEQLQSENESLRVSTGQMEVLRKAEEGKIETLRVEIAQLQQARHAKQQNSQSRHQVKAMANELIQKQAKLDSLSMEGSTLRIQLQSESNRVRSLERELKDVRFELAKERQEGDLEAGASGRGPVKLRSNYRTGAVSLQLGETEINNRTVTSIVRTLNSFGTTMSRVLRRSPVARLMFGGYIFLLHAWVCIVLYHLATEVLESHDL